MFWRVTFAQKRPERGYLAVNRVAVLARKCDACGQDFAPTPMGERSLMARLPGIEPCFFCAGCSDAIMNRIRSEEMRRHFAWDWVVPLICDPK